MNAMKCMSLAVCCAAAAAAADTVLTFAPSAVGAYGTESIPTDVSSPATGDFTWEAWFKASDLNLAENRMVAQTGWAWNDPGRLMLAVRKHKNNPAPGEPAIEAFYYNGGNKRLIGSTVVTEGWHHAALVRSGTTISLYLDGVFETNATDYVNATPSGASTAPFLIGPAFYGSLAEVRLWNVARTAAEIAAAKGKRLAGTEPGLLGYWPLDDGGASVAPVNKVTGVAATPVSSGGNTVGYNQGAGTAAYADDAGLTLTSVPMATTVYTTTAAGGKWSEIAWTPSTPVSGSGAQIVLAGEGAFENDLGTFSLNALTFSATASLSGDGLVFAAAGGANPTLATTGAVTNDVNVAMRLDAPLTWTGDNANGSLRLNGALSGTGDLIHDPTAINIIDYINGDNSAWSGNLDQRLSFIVISNSVNLGTGAFYCTNQTFRVNGRDTLRIYGNNTFANRFYLGPEATALARVDIFGVTTFTKPFGVHGSRIGILNVTTFEGGLYNWRDAESGVAYISIHSGTSDAAKGVAHVNGTVDIRETFFVNAQADNANCKMKVYLHSISNSFPCFQGIRGGQLVMGCDGCYPTNAYFCGQNRRYSGSFLGGVIDLDGHSQTLGYHRGMTGSDTNSSFKIKNGALATMPTVRVMQTADNFVAPLMTEGPMHFIKDGVKTLTMTNAFFVSGTLEVAAGVLRLTVPAEGRLADTVIVREGAILDLGGGTFVCGTLTLDGGEVRNGELFADTASTLEKGTVSASLAGAAIAASGSGPVLYGSSVAAAKTLSTNGLVFYMPFDDATAYLTDEGPDRVTFSCQTTAAHRTPGTATQDTSEKRFGAGSLHLDGKSPLVPTGGNLIDGTFPAHVPTSAAPYTVAFHYKLESGASPSAGMLGYGARAATYGNNYRMHVDNNVVTNSYALLSNYYWNRDMYAILGHGTSHLDGKWHSLVSTWDGTICRFYDDGAEVTPVRINRNATDAPNVTPEFFWVGATLNAPAWRGWLDEMAIFDRAISADEVLAYHQNGVEGGMAPTQAISVSAGSTATVGHSLTNGLVFHMPFDSAETYLQDEGPDRVTFACQTTARHTTLGTATCDTSEKRFGTGALRLDGKSPLVPTGGTLAAGYMFPAHVPVGAAHYTVAISFKSAVTAGSKGVFGYGVRNDVATQKGNNYEWRADGWINNYYWSNDMKVVTPSTIYDGCWHTLVSTWDGSDWRFWLDGRALAYDATYGRGKSKTPPNVDGRLFWVGACLNSDAWNGWIDELAIWNRALTEEEALAYNAFGVCSGATAFDASTRVEVGAGAALKASNGIAASGTLAAAGTIEGDLTLADGATVEEHADGTPTVTGRVTIEGTGSFVPCAYPTSTAMEWTVLTALGGFTAGADIHARTWGIPNLATTFIASGNASGAAFKMCAYPRGTFIMFR